MSQNININETPGLFMPTVYCSQYDVGRTIKFKVTSSEGYDIPSGATVKMEGTKPSGLGFTLNGTVSGNEVTFVSTDGETECFTDEAGIFAAELSILSGTDVIGTANFYIEVEPSPHPDGTTDGKAETIIPTLTLLVERVEAAASSILDMQVVADTLPAGSDATYSYDEETNTATFGIPKGADGSLASGVLAPTYSSSATYAVGDYVYYSGNLYRCAVAITTAEAWTVGHWTQVALGDDVTDLKSDISAANVVADSLTQSNLFELGSISNSTGAESDATSRVRTDYIDIDEYTYFSIDGSGLYNYWIRVYDSSKTFLGNARAASSDILSSTSESSYGLLLSLVRKVFSTAKYVRIVYKRTNNADITPEECKAVLHRSDWQKVKTTLPIEIGTINLTTGNIYTGADDIGNAENYFRSSHFIEVIPSTTIYIESDINISVFSVAQYDSDYGYISKIDSYTGFFALSPTTKYVKFRFLVSSHTLEDLNTPIYITALAYDSNLTFKKNIRTSTDCESFLYQVNNGTGYTTGKLKLPSNYSNDGKAVPLIVFVHGSGDLGTMATETMTTNYETYYNYLRDNGYAIFDCYGWDSNHLSTGSNTWGAPNNIQCFKSGIEFVLKDWNIDRNNIFVASKSLGGILAGLFAFDSQFKAIGMLAPELNMLTPDTFGYSKSVRVAIAEDLDFTGDWESVINVSNENFAKNDAYWAVISANANNMCGYIPEWKNVPLSISQKIDDAKNYNFNNSQYQICNVPVKIWIAQDDGAVYYEQSEGFVQKINNGGGVAVLRTMPSGTGGHHSVDTDANAPQTANVTTILGETYASIPTAYYELCEWFNSHLN